MYTPTEDQWQEAEATLRTHLQGRTLHMLRRVPENLPCSFAFHFGPSSESEAIVWGDHVIMGYGSVPAEVFADYAGNVDLSAYPADRVAHLAMCCSIQPQTAFTRWQYFETRGEHEPQWVEIEGGAPAVAICYLSREVDADRLAELQAQLSPGETREIEVESPAERHLLQVDGTMLAWYPMTFQHSWQRRFEGPKPTPSRKTLAVGLLVAAGVALAVWQLAF